MSRILSILIALSAVLAVLAAPIPTDDTFDLRDIPEDSLDIATREYLESLSDVERRGFFKKFKSKLGGLAKTAVGFAAGSNPFIGIAANLATRLPGKTGRRIGGAVRAVGLAKRFEDDDDEVFLRDVDDELALRDEEFAEFDVRDVADEDLALATRDYIDSLDEFERRNFFRKAKNFISGAGRKLNSVTSNPIFGAAVNVAGQFGGRRGRQLSRTASRVSSAASYFGRDFEDDEELSLRDVDDELDLRDVSDEDLALTLRAVWDDLDEVERRGIFDRFKSAVSGVASRVTSAVSQARQFVAPAQHILGVAGNLAGKYGGNRGRALATGLRTANRGISRANRATRRIGLRDVEDEE